MTPTSDGLGYWLLAADGGVFNFGDAAFAGSAGGAPSPDPAEKLVAPKSGPGYWIVDQNGTVNPFGGVTGNPPTQGLMFRPVTAGDKAVLFAFAQLGKPYIWGGNGPVGYDCSGLALASWKNAAGIGFARVSDDQYHTAGSARPDERAHRGRPRVLGHEPVRLDDGVPHRHVRRRWSDRGGHRRPRPAQHTRPVGTERPHAERAAPVGRRRGGQGLSLSQAVPFALAHALQWE